MKASWINVSIISRCLMMDGTNFTLVYSVTRLFCMSTVSLLERSPFSWWTQGSTSMGTSWLPRKLTVREPKQLTFNGWWWHAILTVCPEKHVMSFQSRYTKIIQNSSILYNKPLFSLYGHRDLSVRLPVPWDLLVKMAFRYKIFRYWYRVIKKEGGKVIGYNTNKNWILRAK